MRVRQFKDVSVRVKDDLIGSFRMRVEGGATGDHIVKFDSEDWYCDCLGFTNHKHCRHVNAGKKILLFIYRGIDEINKPEQEPAEEVHVLS